MTGAVDPEALAGLRQDLGEAVARDLLRMFLETTPEQVAAIERAEGARELASAAHRLRGGCMAVGACSLADACAAVEDAANAQRPDGELRSLVAEVRRAWDATRSRLA